MKLHAFSKHNIIYGALSGAVAGIVLGLMMLRMGVLADMGMVIGMPNPLSGFILHFVVDITLGILFAIIFFKCAKTFFSCILSGVAFAILWWILSMLILVPLLLGYPISWYCGSIPVLMAELVFGLVLGLSYYFFKSKHKPHK